MKRSTTLNEGSYSAEFLESEANNRRSREQVTLKQSADFYPPGTVLMADGAAMVAFDGSGDAAGVLLIGIDASAEDTEGTAVVRDAEVTMAELNYPDAVTPAQKDAAVAKLAESGVIAR